MMHSISRIKKALPKSFLLGWQFLMGASLTLGLCLPLWAGEENIGALFLDEPTGARATALGEALVGTADDANAVYWNPAGLVRVGQRQLLLAHTQSYQGFRNEYAALIWDISATDAIGWNGYYAYSDPYDKLSETGEQTGTYTLSDMYSGLTWSHGFDSALSGAITLKGLRQVIDTYSAWSAALDAGLYWAKPQHDFSLGLTLCNAGKPMVFIEQAHPLNTAVELGLAYRLWDQQVLLLAAVRKPLFQDLSVKAGIEYTFQNILALRLGYRLWQNGNTLGPWSGVSVGLGVRISDYDLDYAYSPFPELGDVHRISFTLPLGRSLAEERRMLEMLEKQVKAKQRDVFDQTVAEGDIRMKQGAVDQAISIYSKAFAMNPNDRSLNQKLKAAELAVKQQTANRHAALGRKALQEKDYLTALVEWSKVLELLPNHEEATQMITKANQQLSAEKLSGETNKNRQQIDQYFRQGLQYLQNGHYGDALDVWKKILSLDPTNPKVAQYLRMTQTKLDDVVEDLLRLADQEWENGQYLNAVKKWRQVLDLSASHPKALARLESNKTKLTELADQYYRQGVQEYIQTDLDSALATWYNVLAFDPKNTKATQHIEQVKKKRKELDAIQ